MVLLQSRLRFGWDRDPEGPWDRRAVPSVFIFLKFCYLSCWAFRNGNLPPVLFELEIQIIFEIHQSNWWHRESSKIDSFASCLSLHFAIDLRIYQVSVFSFFSHIATSPNMRHIKIYYSVHSSSWGEHNRKIKFVSCYPCVRNDPIAVIQLWK